MHVDSISNGIVIDHIKAGKSMEIYNFLNLDTLDCSVAIIKNVKSTKMFRKDIIKIDADINIDLDILGYIDPNITVNIIKDGKLVKKCHIKPPERIVNIKKCKNPRCVTSVEPGVDHIFVRSNGVYRCYYCDSEK
jgi:aspartate carbamoyltransferase regulatory subunit